jgi:hypothetical protein
MPAACLAAGSRKPEGYQADSRGFYADTFSEAGMRGPKTERLAAAVFRQLGVLFVQFCNLSKISNKFCH